jgi:hypothetical protein
MPYDSARLVSAVIVGIKTGRCCFNNHVGMESITSDFVGECRTMNIASRSVTISKFVSVKGGVMETVLTSGDEDIGMDA